ncbi:hypothetical protein U1Q18_036782 [Sarracenia purpurea var. burkii]
MWGITPIENAPDEVREDGEDMGNSSSKVDFVAHGQTIYGGDNLVSERYLAPLGVLNSIENKLGYDGDHVKSALFSGREGTNPKVHAANTVSSAYELFDKMPE